jgi:hypothetical protein
MVLENVVFVCASDKDNFVVCAVFITYVIYIGVTKID